MECSLVTVNNEPLKSKVRTGVLCMNTMARCYLQLRNTTACVLNQNLSVEFQRAFVCAKLITHPTHM